MNIRIQAQGFALTPAIAARVHDKVGRALDRYSSEIMSVDVYLKDVNGPKGGSDKHALVKTQLRYRSPSMVESAHSDLYAAIDQSARRTRRAVKKTLSRHLRASRGDARRMRYMRALTADL